MMQPQMHFSSMPTPMLNAQIGTPEWQQQLNQQIVMFSRNGLQKLSYVYIPKSWVHYIFA